MLARLALLGLASAVASTVAKVQYGPVLKDEGDPVGEIKDINGSTSNHLSIHSSFPSHPIPNYPSKKNNAETNTPKSPNLPHLPVLQHILNHSNPLHNRHLRAAEPQSAAPRRLARAGRLHRHHAGPVQGRPRAVGCV